MGTRLLHIGPAKTGTTTLQSAFDQNRAELRAHGVQYARGRQARAAAAAVAFGRPIPGASPASLRRWDQLVRDVHRSTADRFVISSETFAHSSEGVVRTITDALDPTRLHVVITMRPLADLLGSSWQQYVQGTSGMAWEEWLEEVLRSEKRDHAVVRSFWRRSRIDRLARRWGSAIGFDNVTVVSLADRPRDFVLRTFEDMVGVPTGTLIPDSHLQNLSLNYPAAEVLRKYNLIYAGQPDGSRDEHAMLIELGAMDWLKRSGTRLQPFPIPLPRWAADRAGEIAAEMNSALSSSGVRVVGDLDALRTPSKPPTEASASPPASISTDDAAALLYGLTVAHRRRLARATQTSRRRTLASRLFGRLARRRLRSSS